MAFINARARLGAAAFRLAACGALLALAASPAVADVKAGVDAWTAGDYARAVAEWQGPAAEGDPDALFNLAQAYRLGRGVTASNERARVLYEQAAQRGHIRAADNYGLLLFQAGEHAKAMPLIRAAADRGDPRAQYVLGLSHFNADQVPRDWVRAYALVTLARSQGLPQAQDALQQMDRYVPEPQRQQAQSLARQLESEAQRRRSTDLAAANLGGDAPALTMAAATTAAAPPQPRPVPQPASIAPPVATPSAAAAVASLAAAAAKPAAPQVALVAPSAAPPAASPAPAPVFAAAPPAPAASSPAAPRSGGSWRVQLGAFGVAANADRLWNQLSGHPVLVGTRKTLLPSGKLTRLLATGFASESEAARACAQLKQQGQACLVAGQG